MGKIAHFIRWKIVFNVKYFFTKMTPAKAQRKTALRYQQFYHDNYFRILRLDEKEAKSRERDSARTSLLKDIQEELRAAKNYYVADKLRDIINLG